MGSRYKKTSGATAPITAESLGLGVYDTGREGRLYRAKLDARLNIYENSKFGPPAPSRPPRTVKISLSGGYDRRDLRDRVRSRALARAERQYNVISKAEYEALARGANASRWGARFTFLARTVSPYMRLLDFAQTYGPTLEEALTPVKNPREFVPVGPWAQSLEYVCTASPFRSPGANDYDKIGYLSGFLGANYCGLSGQASPGVLGDATTYRVPATLASGNRTWIIFERRGQFWRRRYDQIWHEHASGQSIAGSGFALVPWRAVATPFGMPNPNAVRATPGTQEAFQEPVPLTLAEAVVRSFERTKTRLGTATEVRTQTGGGVGAPTPTRPGPAEPPPRGTKEKKMTGPVRLVLAVMDAVSESAEVVDAIYQALPAKTRKRWGCDKIKRGLLDSAGQYGIDAADCKMRALWHNWASVDMEQAVKNIVANEVQDRVIGGLSGAQPRNIGRATEDAQKAVNDVLEALFETVGLQ